MIDHNFERPSLPAFDTICFSHLRWNFVFQRPQHLMQRFAKRGRVFFVEEPFFNSHTDKLEVTEESENVFVCVPHLRETGRDSVDEIIVNLIDKLLLDYDIRDYIAWFYTPMMLEWSRHLSPFAVVYDCMDELSNFKDAPPLLRERESKLFRRADLVFTGGRSLFEAKRKQHPAVYAFPSSIDVAHFARALDIREEIPEQTDIPHPRIGFVGVIDERSDLDLLESVAGLGPDWNFIMVGPVVKIDENSLPKRANIHYLGQKSYDELPAILAGWDAAIMPFAMNESTRYISPTKTPEYLAAGLPVVSTPITDVVAPYGEMGLVKIASTPEEFAAAIKFALLEDPGPRREKANEFLSKLSWDKTFDSMRDLIIDCIREKEIAKTSAQA